jgi:hypothetical protein
MSTWERLTRAGRSLLGREHAPEPAPTAAPAAPASRPISEPIAEPLSEPASDPDPSSPPPPPGAPPFTTARGFTGWFEQRAQRVVEQAYQTRAADLEERAMRAMTSVYEKAADDLEERAVRAMRRAIEAEAGRLQTAIEHGIAVKKREVRLSLLVLVVSSLVYLTLYWFTSRPGAP